MTVIVFDFDDTLIFSRSDRALRLMEAIQGFGHGVDNAALASAWGKPFKRMVTTISPSLEAEFDNFLQFYASELTKSPPNPCPGVISTLPQLAKRARLLVHSASHSLLVRTDLHSLGILPLFDFVCGSDWQAEPKPHPQSLTFLWQLPGLGTMSPSEVYYVGDSATDADIAEHAGVNFVRANYAESSKSQRFNASCPTIADLEDLLAFL